MPLLNLTKGHGCGVDVLVIDSAPATAGEDGELTALVRRLCDRRGPFGAEAVYFVEDDAAEPEFWCFDAAGGAVRGSAYGLGVVGRILLDRRGLEAVVLRRAGERHAIRRSEDSPEGVKRVVVDAAAISHDAAWAQIGEIVPELSARRPVTSVAVPEAQLVSIVGRFAEDELTEMGRRVEVGREVFPGHPDVSFLMPLDEDGEVFVHTYEFGAGVTRSSAAGVVAARAVYSRLGVVEPEASVLVRTPGGPVRTVLHSESESWIPTLETNATLTYTAGVDPKLLAAPVPLTLDLETNLDEIRAYAALRSANAQALKAAGVRYSAP
jgi:diaminopimelate epimerase